MTYQEAKWIVQEVEKAKADYPSMNGKWGWFFPDKNVSHNEVDEMDFGEVVKAVMSFYGAYDVGDIVLTNAGLPCLITNIENYNTASTIHDIMHHVIFANGTVATLKIDDIASKVDESVINISSLLKSIVEHNTK